jgi:hypothetical protein
MREIRVSVFLLAGVFLILIALGMINLRLQKRNTELGRQIEFTRTVLAAAEGPRPGTIFPAEIPAIAPTGGSAKINIPSSIPKVVILLFEPNCTACEDNWRYWDKLRNEENAGGGFLPVSTSQNISKAYLEKHHIARSFIGVVNEALQKSLNIHATPQTILVENGIVRRVWFGVLSNDDVRDILNALKN